MLPAQQETTIEAKYTFPLGSTANILTTIGAVSIRDPRFAESRVNSIYFDTPNRYHLAEKVNSDYIKTKVRLRWYEPIGEPDKSDEVTAFLEVKAKEGTQRFKGRVALQVPRDALRAGAENFSLITQLANHSFESGYHRVGPLFAMIAIRYVRARFVEPESNARISIDRMIGYSGINRLFYPPREPRQLTAGVVEVKNRDGNLPDSFIAARKFLNRRDSFSKYEECWQLHADPFYRRDFRWMHFER